MRQRATTLWIAAVLGVILQPVRPAFAQGDTIHVLVSNGVKAVVDELKPQAERAIGHPLSIEFGTTSGLKQKIEAGENFDATFLTSDAIADLVKSGKLAGSSSLARCGIGMGARAGAPKPDIRTPEALKETLHKAKAITYAQDGASRVFIEKMMGGFGIADQMKAKTMLVPGSVKSNELVAAGKADYVLTLVSEILPAPGVELIGPLPEQVQNYISFSAGVSAKAAHAESGKALVQFFKGPAAAAVYKAKGLEPR